MGSYINFLQQLPNVLQLEIAAHLGSIAGMTELQIVSRYRDVAAYLKQSKLASIQPSDQGYPGHLTVEEFNSMSGAPLPGVAPVFVELHRQLLASEGAWYLENFINQLFTVQAHLEQAARQLAQQQAQEAARQLAQRQAHEAAQRLAQQQAEEAARQLAQRQAEEAARQLAQQQAAEAARLAAQAAARQLAQQQAQAAALAFAQRAAEEQALREARLALELAAAPASVEVPIEDAINRSESPVLREATEIRFIPGPAATAAIEQATVKLKRSIDASISQFASDIGPYLKPAQAGAGMGMTHSA